MDVCSRDEYNGDEKKCKTGYIHMLFIILLGLIALVLDKL